MSFIETDYLKREIENKHFRHFMRQSSDYSFDSAPEYQLVTARPSA